MSENPIIFSTPMVCAILAGNKTQTRRIVKPQPPEGFRYIAKRWNIGDSAVYWDWGIDSDADGFVDLPFTVKGRINIGDILWVRETWARMSDRTNAEVSAGTLDRYIYKADWSNEEDYPKWKPSIHMPKSAARIYLQVTDVRAQRLKEISQQDCIKEGFAGRGTFGHYWDIIHKNHDGYGFSGDPWVFIYDFERVETP